MAKDYIGFTVDLRVLVSVLAQDPRCKEEILAGLQCEKEPITSQLGAANFGTQEAPRWASLFPATVEGKESGQEGLVYRNNSHGGAGDRIQMRLREQGEKKTQPAQKQYQVTTAQQAMPQGAGKATAEAAAAELQKTDPKMFAQLLALVQADQGKGQLSAETHTQTQAAASPNTGAYVIPADIAEVVGK